MKLRLISALILLCASFCGHAQTPAGYLRKGLKEGRDVIAQRADTYAEMLTMKNPGIPKQFVVESDESTGQTNVVYYWDGLQIHSSAASSTDNTPAYFFKSTPGTDVTTALQAALDTYKDVAIDNSYIISNTLAIPSGGSLIGHKNSVLKAASARSGLLSTRGAYINLNAKSFVTVTGIKFQPDANMTNMASYANAVIIIENATNCLIDNNSFDFSFAYSLGMDAVWITGPNCKYNTVSNNYVKTLGITYCENGASFNTIEKNQLINSSANALGGIGNHATIYCTANVIRNNYIENAGRMGIEDQQKTTGNIIEGNTIKGVGLHPAYSDAFIGISAVATNTFVNGNTIEGALGDLIEVRGKSGNKVVANTGTGNGVCLGVIANFTSTTASDNSNYSTYIADNKFLNCGKGITTFGDGTEQDIEITNNTIIEAANIAIDINTASLLKSRINISNNTIYFNNASATWRTGISTYTTIASGLHKIACTISSNSIHFGVSAGNGNGIVPIFDGARVLLNSVYGEPGGGTINSITNNAATTTSLQFLGNKSVNASFNIAQFPNSSLLDNSITTAGQINTALGYTAADNTSVVNLKKLPVDSRIVYIGDSITAHGFGTSGGGFYYYGDGYPTNANILSGHRFFQPVGGNKGVSGENSTQILSRLGAILELKPKVAVVLIGTNDVSQSVTELTIKNNIGTIYKALNAIGCKVIAITIPNRYAPIALLSTGNETIRTNVNTWIKSNTDLAGVVDAEPILNNASLFADGLHPNTQGDFLLGQSVASVLNTLVDNSISAGYQISPESVSNYALSGGSTLATGWSNQVFLGGATLTPTKTTANGAEQQVLTVSGTYTGNGNGFNFKQDYTTTYYKEGDIIEGILDVEITAPFVNVNSVAPSIQVYSASYAATLANSVGYYPTATDDMFYPIGRYTIKSPPVLITGGTPAIVTTGVSVLFKNAASSTAISGQIKIYRIGSRKVNLN